MATIKPIEGRSVHQIQSGQVIVDLQSVCKELVENSIDAGATTLEVRFRNNGLDAIEVQDNGSGISPADHETIALKHYTSKLATYDDLSSLHTFGFRGEALSSLCALSNFHIVTARATDGPKGTKLEFEQSGKLKGTSVVAAKQGTTVVVESLFHNLPVRRKELEKNIKREYNKVLQLLNAYACISVGVKFSVSNQALKGKKTIAFSTNANASTRDNISNVYGAKTVAAMIPLHLKFEMLPSHRPGATQSARTCSTQDEPESRTIEINGHISRPVVGEGRQTPDRQMFFVNSRPCNLPQVAKAFNEVYKSFNITQSPFIFADIKLDTNAYDVNVSPDKRTIMLHDQIALLEQLKEALFELFDAHDQSVPQAQMVGRATVISTLKPPTLHARQSTTSTTAEDRTVSPAVPESTRYVSPDSVESQASARTYHNDTPMGFVKASLIERFAGRDAEDRASRSPVRRARDRTLENSNVLEDRVILPSVTRRSPSAGEDLAKEADLTKSPAPLFEQGTQDDLQQQRPQPIKIVEDFNARIASQQALHVDRVRSVSSPRRNMSEQSIPALEQTPRRSTSQNIVQNAFDRMRPLRTPLQQATITIGDTITVSTIGANGQSTSAKSARIHTPKFSLSGKPLDQTPKRSLFRNRLSNFAAPGAQLDSSDEEEEEEIASPRSNGSRTPSQHELTPQQAYEELQRDGLVEPSSVPQSRPRLIEATTSHAENAVDPTIDSFNIAEDSGDEYIDETEKKAREEAKIAKMIDEAEEAAARPTGINMKRANKLFKVTAKKYWTINLGRVLETTAGAIAQHLQNLQAANRATEISLHAGLDQPDNTQTEQEDPEERLSLTVTKPDFILMRIIGQFNLGFIIAVRPPTLTSPNSDLFIIDQHASDEKYNFERLSATTTLVSQRLVHPHPLELTAVEEEIILANEQALIANGFVVDLHTAEEEEAGHRARLMALPMSKEVTFTPKDLEELLALVLDNPPSCSTSTSPHIPRPSKVRKLLASRACRSSVMIGKTLQHTRMKEIVRHMGSMDKPWSCPHGRPTMRHLYGLEQWRGWTEGDGVTGVEALGGQTDWTGYLEKNRH
ncbi:ATP-binding mismatch repair protein [Coniothyrium glycines]